MRGMLLCLKDFLLFVLFHPSVSASCCLPESIGNHFQMYAFLTLYNLFCHSVCGFLEVFFGQCSFKPSVSLKPSWLCTGLVLSDNWFSCLRDSHIVNEGSDLPCPCVIFLFPGELPCCLVKLVYFRILAADALNQLKEKN